MMTKNVPTVLEVIYSKTESAILETPTVWTTTSNQDNVLNVSKDIKLLITNVSTETLIVSHLPTRDIVPIVKGFIF